MPGSGATGSSAGGGTPGAGSGGAPGAGGAGTPGGSAAGGGYGPLTPAEQVAILDAQLEKGAGEFDSMILKTEAEQREAARAAAVRRGTAPTGASAAGSGGEGDESGGAYGNNGAYDDGGSPEEDGVADAGTYGSGSGSGNVGAGSTPRSGAKYPPPADIPSGNDDDVVARQLREAAEREPDPAVRAKLWDEYRKYKGI